jgi:hypothetical protein
MKPMLQDKNHRETAQSVSCIEMKFTPWNELKIRLQFPTLVQY